MKKYSFTSDLTLLECGKGWHPLIEELFDEIEVKVSLNKEKYKEYQLLQIKEKFGGIRIYFSFFDKEIEEIIGSYAIRFLNTCEYCGKEGEMRYLGFSSTTMCANCFDEKVEKLKLIQSY